MPVQFKSKLTSASVNQNFLDKTIDDLKKGKLKLYKVDPNEVDAVEDVQVYLNELADASGVDGESDATSKTYSSHEVIADGDDRKVAIGKLDAQMKTNIDDINFNSDHINELADTQGTTKGDVNRKVYATNNFIADGDSQKTAIEKFDVQMKTNADEIQAIEDSVGAADGIAPLNSSTKIDAVYLPSYVDDVEEYANLASFPGTGETGKVYVALDTNKTYRWSGSTYIEISPSDVNSVNGQTGIVVLDSDDIAQGTDNFYTFKDTKTNLDALTRVEGKFYYATDEQTGYIDDGTQLIEIGKGGFNEIDTKTNLDALVREQGKIYYATDEDQVYTDDGTQLVLLGGSGLPTLAKGSLITSDGANNGELSVGTDNQFLSAQSSESSGLQWQAILQVPSGGTTGQVLTKTATGYEWQTPTGGGMQYISTVNVTLTQSAGSQYTVPSNRVFHGQIARNSNQTTSAYTWVSTTSTDVDNAFGVGNVARQFSLGGGGYFRNNIFNAAHAVRITGYLLGN